MLPTFHTDRLLLRPRTMGDLDDCLAMDRDPQVTQHIAGPWKDPDRHRAFVVDRIQTRWPDGLGYWTIVPRADPQTFLGWILLLPCLDFGDEIEIGWRLPRRHWGHGYATEAARPVLRHAFDTVGVNAVIADIHPQNHASIHVAEKLGLRFVEDRTIAGEPARSYQIDHTGTGRHAG